MGNSNVLEVPLDHNQRKWGERSSYLALVDCAWQAALGLWLMRMHKTTAGKDLVFQIQSEFRC